MPTKQQQLPTSVDFAQLAQSRTPLVIAGATASGKSKLALQLAQTYSGEIVNLDPFQALKGLRTLTAQPSEQELQLVPHHLYGCYPLQVELNAAEFALSAQSQVEQLQQTGKWPLIVTGSGLYLRAFSHGLSPNLPPTPPALQAELSARPLAENVAELQALDPLEATRIDLQNPRRVERALALCQILGEPISQYRKADLGWEKPPQQALEGLVLTWEREPLWARIQARAQQMFASEALANELWALETGTLGPTASRVIGLKLAQDWLGGQISTEKATEKLSILTRQYAKRQRTWFAKESWMQPIAAEEVL